MTAMKPTSIETVVKELRAGRMVVLADDEQRENEGDFVMIAQLATAEAITFMAENARTIITLALSAERCEQLNLPLMPRDNNHSQDTAFTVTIDAAEGVTTGSSASDRLRTVKAAVSATAKPTDLVRPGHVFPLRAAPGGVLNRTGHTEAACDLARLAGFEPAGLISEIQLDNGEMARMPDLQCLVEKHGLLLTTIADLIEYRCRTESLIDKDKESEVVTPYGKFKAHFYRDMIGDGRHVALVKGNLGTNDIPIVRVIANPNFLDCMATNPHQRSWSAMAALRRINEAKCGVLLGLHIANPNELGGCGDNISEEHASFQVRNYGIGAQVLRDLGVSKMCLLSSPLKMPSLEGFGLDVVEIVGPEGKNG